MNALVDARTGGIPLYQAVRLQLKADLDSGRWKPGQLLPTELELAKHFGVSTGTIRQAVLAMVREGLLTRRPGSGTFVARLDSKRGFGRFFRFTEGLHGAVVPTTRHVDTILIAEGDPVVAAKLRIAPHAPLYRVRRMLLANGDPICLYVSYLDRSRFEDLETIDLENRKLYAQLEASYGTHVLKAEEILRAGAPSAEEADLLGVSRSTPVMIVERTAFGNQGSVVEWRRTVGRSDQFHYKIELP